MSDYNNKDTTLFKLRLLLPLVAWIFLVANPLSAQQREIWEIQGSGNVSPFLGQTVSTIDNVVTAVGEDFFFIQTPAARSDDDANTSDGLFVYTGFPPGLSVGELVDVSGEVREFDELTEIGSIGLTFQVTGATAPLPDPVVFDAEFPGTIADPIRDLERVEGMRVSFTAPVVAPAGFSQIAGLSTAPQRPFREAGIEYPGQTGLPVWDGNPETFWIDPDALDQPNNRFLSAGQTVTATGVLFQADDLYIAFPATYSVSGSVHERDLPPAADDEVTIGSLNVLQLRDDSELLSIQLEKVSSYIVERLGTPDILALQEVGDLEILELLNNTIDQIAPDAGYTAYLIQGNNNTPINSAYLVRDRIRNVVVSQLGAIETLTIGGSLHDRPPLLLEAELPTDPPLPVSVINLHLRSLGGIEGSNAFFVRTKRYEQSLSVAEMIQDRQDENLFVVGDFNALPFSDGYVDVLSQLTGTSSLGAEFPVQNTVDPPLTNYAFETPTDERYSFVFSGNAQLIDHCLSTELIGMEVSDFAFARGNADASSAYYPNPALTTRASDHDGYVLYLQPDAPIVSTDTPTRAQFDWQLPNPVRSGATIPLPEGADFSQLQLHDLQGKLVRQWSEDLGTSVQLPALPGGMYILSLEGVQRKIVIE